jgi:hypothetical protein
MTTAEEKPAKEKKQLPCLNCGGLTSSKTRYCSGNGCNKFQSRVLNQLSKNKGIEITDEFIANCVKHYSYTKECGYLFKNGSTCTKKTDGGQCSAHYGRPVAVQCLSCGTRTSAKNKVCGRCERDGIIVKRLPILEIPESISEKKEEAPKPEQED